MDEIKKNTFEHWCIVEVFGHQRYAGYVTEQTIGGCSFVRVDVPETVHEHITWVDGEYRKVQDTIAAYSKLFGQGAIYSITPCTEKIARTAARSFCSTPVSCVELPARKELPGTPSDPAEASNPEIDDDELDMDEEEIERL